MTFKSELPDSHPRMTGQNSTNNHSNSSFSLVGEAGGLLFRAFNLLSARCRRDRTTNRRGSARVAGACNDNDQQQSVNKHDQNGQNQLRHRHAQTSGPVIGKNGKRECVVIVDPLSTGANVSDEILRRGYACVAVISGHVAVEPEANELRHDYLATFQYDPSKRDSLLSSLRALPVAIIAVTAGCELGVEVCDWIAEELGLPGNGTEMSEARRDKHMMGEVVRNAGLRAPIECYAKSWSEVETFLSQPNAPPFPLVVKPARSAGSDSVLKVLDAPSTRRAAESILNRDHNAFGVPDEAVLVQEWVAGREYVVDTVSRGGQHKVVAIWSYDKGEFLGKDFIYRGQGSVCVKSGIDATSSDGRMEAGAEKLAPYVIQVLDALGVNQGAAHAEVILCRGEPCLVEVGCRPQGCDGTFMPLADLSWGYNQVSSLVDSITTPDLFDSLPSSPPVASVHNFKIDFVCAVRGRLRRIQHLDRMSKLESFVRTDCLPEVGSHMQITSDCFTLCGSVSLAHKDVKQLRRDIEAVREMEKTMWIVDTEGADANNAS